MSELDLSNLDSIIEHFEEIRTKTRNILEKQEQTFLKTEDYYEGELNMCNTVIRILKMHKEIKKKSETNKRKIIEIYVTENEKEDTATFDLEKVEDSKIANIMMGSLVMMFGNQCKGDELEVEYE